MIEAAFLMLAMVQDTGRGVEAFYPDQPETWSIEYPFPIAPFVGSYYDCLRSGSYAVGDGRNFEQQYREDIPRCAKKGDSMLKKAKERLISSKASKNTPPGAVDGIFDKIRKIHVARGRSLDQTVNTNLASSTQRILSSDPASTGNSSADAAQCIALLQTLRQNRKAFSDSEGPKAEAVHAKTQYTDEDRRALSIYQNKLARYNWLISYEMRRCPAEARQHRIKNNNASN